uniref:Secreted protein n=1 Tax=Ascaris lumbricoides TaxID=6252 RepID=A0A0M3HT44_ASCLU
MSGATFRHVIVAAGSYRQNGLHESIFVLRRNQTAVTVLETHTSWSLSSARLQNVSVSPMQGCWTFLSTILLAVIISHFAGAAVSKKCVGQRKFQISRQIKSLSIKAVTYGRRKCQDATLIPREKKDKKFWVLRMMEMKDAMETRKTKQLHTPPCSNGKIKWTADSLIRKMTDVCWMMKAISDDPGSTMTTSTVLHKQLLLRDCFRNLLPCTGRLSNIQLSHLHSEECNSRMSPTKRSNSSMPNETERGELGEGKC